MKVLALLFLLLDADFASAKDVCADSNWTFVGDLTQTIRAYDSLFAGNLDHQSKIARFNSFLKTKGLLQTLSPVNEIKGFPNRLERDGIGGLDVGVFLKRLKVPDKAGLVLDKIYEVADVNATKALRFWQLPYGSNGPSALDGNDLIYEDVFTSVCSKLTFKSAVKVATTGDYELVTIGLPESPKSIPPERCKAAKNLFRDSSYSTCGEVIDLKTKKKRILVWEYPMT